MVNPARSRQKDAVAKRPDAGAVIGLSFEGPRRKRSLRGGSRPVGLAAKCAEVSPFGPVAQVVRAHA
jgi:hypothetical protein